jgi:tetratricopeptide (TPR) repeat protein
MGGKMRILFGRPERILFWGTIGGVIGFLSGALIFMAGAATWEPGLAWQFPTPTATPVVGEELARLEPRLGRAWEQEHWLEVIALLEVLYARDPGYPGLSNRLAEAYLAQGQALVEMEHVEAARLYLDMALAVQPDDPAAQESHYLATNYLRGVDAYQQGDWETASEWLRAVYVRQAGYLHVRDLLYSAYYNLGLARQVGGRLSEARAAFESALQVKGDAQAAYNKIAELNRLVVPTPTPQPSPRRILVDISEQRLYAYEGDRLVYLFVTSTGEPGRDTAPGHYRVLDKIPMAYASIWNLKMPYWLGIYWVGSTENGIHALPILSSGQKLWDGFLGQRVSYGCVILGTEEAKTIYEWAEIGTPVEIVP